MYIFIALLHRVIRLLNEPLFVVKKNWFKILPIFFFIRFLEAFCPRFNFTPMIHCFPLFTLKNLQNYGCVVNKVKIIHFISRNRNFYTFYKHYTDNTPEQNNKEIPRICDLIYAVIYTLQMTLPTIQICSDSFLLNLNERKLRGFNKNIKFNAQGLA